MRRRLLYNEADLLMKTFRILQIVVVLLVFGPAVHAQSLPPAQKVFDSMIEALGGKTYLDVKEIHVTGRYFTFRRDEVSGSEPFVDYIKFPDMERTEFGKVKEQTVEIHHGKDAWVVKPPLKGKIPDVQPQAPAEGRTWLDEFKTMFDYVPRFVVGTPKTTLVNSGSELVDNRRVDVLEVRDAQKNLMRIYVDRETHLPIKVLRRDANESTVKEEHFANWHKFGGVMTPLMIVSYKDGIKKQDVRVDKVVYNSGLADSLFAPPPTTPSK
jgi:hypothetical protein